MKFEVKKQIVTPDGEHHESIEAAHAHMWKHNLEVLADAEVSDFEEAIAVQSMPEGELEPRLLALRHAIREVFLAAWPRASKGQPRKAKEPAGEAPTGDGEPAPAEGQAMTAEPALMGSRHDDEPADEPEDAPKRSHGKKKAA